MVRYAGDAPALSVWKTDVLAATPIPLVGVFRFQLAVFRLPADGKWPLEPVSHRPVRLFRPPLISLSHPARRI